MAPPNSTQRARVIAVVGPTASGKTALAEELAVRLGGEVVSADSMQVYRGMDIGTAKPPVSARRVRHWCLDLAGPDEPFSAALYQRHARAAITDITARRLLPVVAGGTGLYVRAALDPLEFPAGAQSGNSARSRYEAYAAENGPEALHTLLTVRDPESAAVLHPNNVRRVVRALEMLDQGVSYARQSERFSARESLYDARFVGLTLQRDALYARTDERVDAMIAAGLLGEVAGLLEAGLRDAVTASQAIGYRELVEVLDGQVALDEAIASIKQSTRRYAKRQLTWFRADSRVRWIDVTELTLIETARAAEAALDLETT